MSKICFEKFFFLFGEDSKWKNRSTNNSSELNVINITNYFAACRAALGTMWHGHSTKIILPLFSNSCFEGAVFVDVYWSTETPKDMHFCQGIFLSTNASTMEVNIPSAIEAVDKHI